MPKLKKGEKKPAVTAETPLTFREKRFIDALFMTEPPFNGAAAARKAGFSKKSCRVQAFNLLTKCNVKAEIEKRQVEIEKQSEVTRDQWLKKGARFYHADVRKIVDDHGNAIPLSDLDDNEAAMIAGIELVEEFTQVEKKDGIKKAEHTGYTKKFKLVDPMKAHEYYGKIRGYIKGDESPIPPAPINLNVTLTLKPGEAYMRMVRGK